MLSSQERDETQEGRHFLPVFSPPRWPPRTCSDLQTLEAGVDMGRIQLIFARRQSEIFIKYKGDLDPCSSVRRKIIRIID